MKKFVPYSDMLARQTNAEHFDTIEAIVQYVDPKISQITGLEAPMDDLSEKFSIEDVLFKQTQQQPGTEDIINADKTRDDLYQQAKRNVNYHSFSNDEGIAVSARELEVIFNTYKNADRKAYTQNSAYITNLIEDLRKPEHAVAVTVLDFKETIDKLEAANETFKTLFRERTATVEVPAEQSLQQARKDTDAAFDIVARCLEGFYTTGLMTAPNSSQTSRLGDIIDTVNSYLVKARKILARRVPSYGSSSNGDGTPAPEADDDSYSFNIDAQTVTENGYQLNLTDKNPTALSDAFIGVSLKEAKFYIDVTKEKEDTPFIFKGFMFDKDNKIIGITFNSTRKMMDTIGSTPEPNAAMTLDGKVLIRFHGAAAPLFM